MLNYYYINQRILVNQIGGGKRTKKYSLENWFWYVSDNFRRFLLEETLFGENASVRVYTVGQQELGLPGYAEKHQKYSFKNYPKCTQNHFRKKCSFVCLDNFYGKLNENLTQHLGHNLPKRAQIHPNDEHPKYWNHVSNNRNCP